MLQINLNLKLYRKRYSVISPMMELSLPKCFTSQVPNKEQVTSLHRGSTVNFYWDLVTIYNGFSTTFLNL